MDVHCSRKRQSTLYLNHCHYYYRLDARWFSYRYFHVFQGIPQRQGTSISSHYSFQVDCDDLYAHLGRSFGFSGDLSFNHDGIHCDWLVAQLYRDGVCIPIGALVSIGPTTLLFVSTTNLAWYFVRFGYRMIFSLYLPLRVTWEAKTRTKPILSWRQNMKWEAWQQTGCASDRGHGYTLFLEQFGYASLWPGAG